MLCRETVRNRFRGWHNWTVFPVLLTPADQRRIIIMEKYKLLFTADIRITDKGYPLRRCILCTHTHTHTNQSPDIITTKNKNRERVLKTNSSLSNCVLYFYVRPVSLQLRPSKCSDHLLVIEHMICNNICLSFQNSDMLFDVKPSINSILLINVRGTRFTKRYGKA